MASSPSVTSSSRDEKERFSRERRSTSMSSGPSALVGLIAGEVAGTIAHLCDAQRHQLFMRKTAVFIAKALRSDERNAASLLQCLAQQKSSSSVLHPEVHVLLRLIVPAKYTLSKSERRAKKEEPCSISRAIVLSPFLWEGRHCPPTTLPT